MKNELAIIGAPTSAGAYGPGQEKTPDALREAGLIGFLQQQGIAVTDKKNVEGFRWKVDKENKRAMNVGQVARVAKELAAKVSGAFSENKKLLVLGGDCTVELGVVAGCLEHSENIGLIYIDLDTDLNTPSSVEDGALDWMGVAHLLRIDGANEILCSVGRRTPMLHPDQLHFFASGNVNEFERNIIATKNIRETNLQEVAKDPVGTAREICKTWASRFEHILIHLDVDVLDYVDFQIAENYRRNIGLKFDQLMQSLDEFLKLPNWSALTVTEINPAHGEADTLKYFAQRLASSIGGAA
jgi:arginase